MVDHVWSKLIHLALLIWETGTHVVRRTMLPVERFGDKHLPEHRVDVKNLVGWLISSHPSDAVSDGDVLVLV